MSPSASSSHLWGPVVISVGINLLGWAHAVIFKTEKFYDLLGSATFTSCVAYSLGVGGNQYPRQIIASCAVWVWTFRLGFFLLRRVLQTGHDSRFEKAKNEPFTYLIFWILQSIWVWVTALPVFIIQGNDTNPHLRPTDIIGPVLWFLGLSCEAIADFQKSAWRKNPANKGQFINVGLWSRARYPNYGGEILLWSGVYVFCAGIMHGGQFASVVSPVFVAFLLLFVSGVPIQEKQGLERWGDREDYQLYRASTWLLLPLPFRPCWGGRRGVPAGSSESKAALTTEPVEAKA